MKIVYENEDKSIGIITPENSCLKKYGIKAIAKKDVPAGLSYWIVDDSEIPTDMTYRDAWEIDSEWGEPHGYGGKKHV